MPSVDYLSSTTSTNNMTAMGLQQPQRQKEVPAKTELVDKLLHELHEEAIGLNGTFAGVLSPSAPTGTNATEAKCAHASGLGEILDGFAARIEYAITVLRDVRSRCEL